MDNPLEKDFNNQSQEEFYTKDLNEASALLASDQKLLRLEKESHFYWFVFQDIHTKEISNKFWSGDLLIDAKKFSDAIRTLKDRLFAQSK